MLAKLAHRLCRDPLAVAGCDLTAAGLVQVLRQRYHGLRKGQDAAFLTCSGSIRIVPHSSPLRLTSISGSFDAARSTMAPNATTVPANGPQMTSKRSPGV